VDVFSPERLPRRGAPTFPGLQFLTRSKLNPMEIEFPGFFDLQLNGFAGVDFNNPAITP
jgi:hypothetical protein